MLDYGNYLAGLFGHCVHLVWIFIAQNARQYCSKDTLFIEGKRETNVPRITIKKEIERERQSERVRCGKSKIKKK